jgi:hypothetical protein
MDKKEILINLINPTLDLIGLNSPSASTLVFGTGLVETNYNHLSQIGSPKNGAFGFFQCENKTYLEMLKYLKRNAKLSERILSVCYLEFFPKDCTVLEWNLRLSVCICRCHYYRFKEPLPNSNIAVDLAVYHKKYYNTAKGKTNVETSVKYFQHAIDARG